MARSIERNNVHFPYLLLTVLILVLPHLFERDLHLSFEYPRNIRFSCNKCGLCCGNTSQKVRHVLLLDSDVRRIVSETKQDAKTFAISTEHKRFRFEMLKNAQGKCVFLREGQCVIYEVRPLICRFYPFELKFELSKETHVFSFTLECPAINQGKVLSQKDFKKLFELAQERLG